MWTKEEIYERQQEIMLKHKQSEGKKQYVLVESNTNSSQWGQEFALAPQHTQNDTDSSAGDRSH